MIFHETAARAALLTRRVAGSRKRCSPRTTGSAPYAHGSSAPAAAYLQGNVCATLDEITPGEVERIVI